jgi:hypothetical protein
MNIKLALVGLTAIALFAASTQAQNATNFELRLNLRSGKEALELGKMYKTPGGLDYQVDLVKFYISNVTLVKADGSLLPLPGISLTEFRGQGATMGAGHSANSSSVTAAGQMMSDGQMYKAMGTQNTIAFKARVPAGEYWGVRFEVGVPKELNNQDASLQQLPLGVEAGMFWAWNPGYIFYRFEGKTMINGKPQPFLLHMGTDAFRLPVNAFDLQTNKVKFKVTDSSGQISMNLDVAKAFEKDPSGAVGWDLSKPEKRVMHGGPNVGQAYLNLLGGWGLSQ